MSRLLPFQSDTEVPEDRAPRVVDLEGEDAEKVFGALSSETARAIFTALHEEPMTASDVADAVDSSIQNVRYHLENLTDAGLVEVVDTWYSSRGNEMKVYAPKDGPLIVSSDESRASRIRTALSRLVGGVGVLAASSLVVQYAWTELFGPAAGSAFTASGGAPAPNDSEATAVDAGTGGADGAASTSGGGNASTATSADGGDIGINNVDTTAATETAAGTGQPTAEPTVTETAAESLRSAAQTTTEVATTAADGGGGDLLAGGLPPGAMFFLGGFVVLVVLLAYQYRASPY
ncbi:helix-turn-helix domain-containing protein [Halorubellus sp. PRR65]|uniref:ArsR/SmtB family transcription factor n=1 Tax=Halorubellus sp. PRR65 TaxID=3098148 RepID=UPI002B261A93|nr:helix-turn-helix domain-containing protein [Halorubellus sp. PRR65]